jgi:hypothetical protein
MQCRLILAVAPAHGKRVFLVPFKIRSPHGGPDEIALG